jgi:hypothetical protein
VPRWQRIYLAACGGVIGYAVAYVASDFGPLPRATYDPIARSWEFVAMPESAEPMALYGMLLWGLSGAIVGAALVLLATRLSAGALSRRWLHLAGGWALTAVGLAGMYFMWNLWPF